MTSLAIESVDTPSTTTPIITEDAKKGNPITHKRIVETCVKHGGYRTPSCNEKLYLHHAGYDKIDGLDAFDQAAVLWLEGNCFRTIENLHHCPLVKQLYLHENCITHIAGLDALTQLVALNLSDNFISKVENIDAVAGSLTTLQIKNNAIKDPADFEELAKLTKLTTLDLSGNKIEDMPALLDVLKRMPALRSLRIAGNPCVRSTANMRKVVLTALSELKALDEKPVFADERRLVGAWSEGGLAGERAEREKIREEERVAVVKRLQDFRKFVNLPEDDGVTTEEDSSSDEDDTEKKTNTSDAAVGPAVSSAAVSKEKTAAAAAAKQKDDEALNKKKPPQAKKQHVDPGRMVAPCNDNDDDNLDDVFVPGQ